MDQILQDDWHCTCWIIPLLFNTKNPLSAGTMLSTTNDYLKYMPLDKNTSKILNPILDFTSKQQFGKENTAHVLPVQHMELSNQERKLMSSGRNPYGGGAGAGAAAGSGSGPTKVKRSVSETKKNSLRLVRDGNVEIVMNN